MGRVYAAEHLDSGRLVAMKLLTGSGIESGESRSQLLREAQLAASVGHQNTVFVFGVEETSNGPAVVMELVEGGTLRDRLRTGPLAIKEVVRIGIGLCRGLAAIHAGGILHRDIKPSNCFIEADGTSKLGDFGISRNNEPPREGDATFQGFAGTPGYASPEQLQGQRLTPASDIFSLGATIYEAMTGVCPFAERDLVRQVAAVLTKEVEEPRKLRPEVSERLSQVLLRCLAKSPADRFQSAQELLNALIEAEARFEYATAGARLFGSLLDSIPTLVLLNGLIGPFSGSYYIHSFVVFSIIRSVLYGVLEGSYGWSPGKLVVGLRVRTSSGQRLGLKRGITRSLLFDLSTIAGAILMTRFVSEELRNPLALAMVGCWVLMFLPSIWRKRVNGFHDLAVDAEVMTLTAAGAEATASIEATLAVPNAARHLGPYWLVSEAGRGATSVTWHAWDPVLQRNLWVVEHTVEVAPLLPSRRDLRRPGRARWLGGLRNGAGQRWDAFEQAPGQPLTVVQAPRNWLTVRNWLLEIAEELTLDGELVDQTSADSIWITSRGHAISHEFPIANSGSRPSPLFGEVFRRFDQSGECNAPFAIRHGLKIAASRQSSTREFFELIAPLLWRYQGAWAGPQRARQIVLAPAVILLLWGFITVDYVPTGTESEFDRLRQRIDRFESNNDHASANELRDFAATKLRQVLPRADDTSKPEWQRELARRKVVRPLSSSRSRAIARDLYGRGFQFVDFLAGVSLLLAVLTALVFRNHISFGTFGVVLIDRRGNRASRMLHLARVLVVALPGIAVLSLDAYFNARWLIGIAMGVYFVGIVWSIRSPFQGPVDRLLQTRTTSV